MLFFSKGHTGLFGKHHKGRVANCKVMEYQHHRQQFRMYSIHLTRFSLDVYELLKSSSVWPLLSIGNSVTVKHYFVVRPSEYVYQPQRIVGYRLSAHMFAFYYIYVMYLLMVQQFLGNRMDYANERSPSLTVGNNTYNVRKYNGLTTGMTGSQFRSTGSEHMLIKRAPLSFQLTYWVYHVCPIPVY